jgi:hypothetical protein
MLFKTNPKTCLVGGNGNKFLKRGFIQPMNPQQVLMDWCIWWMLGQAGPQYNTISLSTKGERSFLGS